MTAKQVIEEVLKRHCRKRIVTKPVLIDILEWLRKEGLTGDISVINRDRIKKSSPTSKELAIKINRCVGDGTELYLSGQCGTGIVSWYDVGNKGTFWINFRELNGADKRGVIRCLGCGYKGSLGKFNSRDVLCQEYFGTSWPLRKRFFCPTCDGYDLVSENEEKERKEIAERRKIEMISAIMPYFANAIERKYFKEWERASMFAWMKGKSDKFFQEAMDTWVSKKLSLDLGNFL